MNEESEEHNSEEFSVQNPRVVAQDVVCVGVLCKLLGRRSRAAVVPDRCNALCGTPTLSARLPGSAPMITTFFCPVRTSPAISFTSVVMRLEDVCSCCSHGSNSLETSSGGDDRLGVHAGCRGSMRVRASHKQDNTQGTEEQTTKSAH